MAYTVENYKSKKSMREAVSSGRPIAVYQPGPYGPSVKDGPCAIEGPHYPEPHRWYAEVIVKDGVIIKVKS